MPLMRETVQENVLKILAEWLANHSPSEFNRLMGTITICYQINLEEIEALVQDMIRNPHKYRKEILYMGKLKSPRKGSVLETLHGKVIEKELKAIE